MGRATIGKARYATPPEPGTIVGPNEFGEHLTVLETVDGVTYFGFTTTDDVKAAYSRDPQSVTEVKLR